MTGAETTRDRAAEERPLDAAMDRYAAGEAAAFTVLHRALYPRLVSYLLRMTGSTSAADDLVQETFLRLHRARATFARGAAVVPWAYAIARNVYTDHVRASKHRDTERLPTDPGPDAFDRAAPDGEAEAIAAETARVVTNVLASLPAAQREAFVLLRYEGLSVQDAAAVLGTTATAVKLRAFRAYEALRAALADVAAEPGRKAKPAGAGGGR
jgi:RNA polymerase sigma-70 factor, ECF subfamily